MTSRWLLVSAAVFLLWSTPLPADDKNDQDSAPANCSGLPDNSALHQSLVDAANAAGTVGGLFQGKMMWGAVVNRDGKLCAFTTSTSDPHDVWPGSQSIAKAKAYTANAFSNDSTPLSTARLYTLTQPGHSLWSLGGANPSAPLFLAPTGGQGGGMHHIAGGMIFFGGGVPLYKNGKIVGGLGVSGDTSCADHEIAKRARNLAGMDPPGGMSADDIQYSSADGAGVFTHPLCPNTYRNGTFIGNEPASSGY